MVKRKSAKRKQPPLQLLQVGVGTMVSSMSIAGFILGYVTDLFLNTIPLFLIIFGFLGVLGGIMKAHQMLINAPDPIVEAAKKRDIERSKENRK